MLLAITSAKILLIDIDRTFEPWLEVLQKLEESHPKVPKVVLTGRDPDRSVTDPFPICAGCRSQASPPGRPFRGSGVCPWLELEINDPERAREREARVMAAIRSLRSRGPRPRSLWRLIRARRVCHDGQGDSCLVEIRLSSDPKATCRRVNHRRKPRTAARGLILAPGLGGMILLMLGAGINAVRVLQSDSRAEQSHPG